MAEGNSSGHKTYEQLKNEQDMIRLEQAFDTMTIDKFKSERPELTLNEAFNLRSDNDQTVEKEIKEKEVDTEYLTSIQMRKMDIEKLDDKVEYVTGYKHISSSFVSNHKTASILSGKIYLPDSNERISTKPKRKMHMMKGMRRLTETGVRAKHSESLPNTFIGSLLRDLKMIYGTFAPLSKKGTDYHLPTLIVVTVRILKKHDIQRHFKFLNKSFDDNDMSFRCLSLIVITDDNEDVLDVEKFEQRVLGKMILNDDQSDDELLSVIETDKLAEYQNIIFYDVVPSPSLAVQNINNSHKDINAGTFGNIYDVVSFINQSSLRNIMKRVNQSYFIIAMKQYLHSECPMTFNKKYYIPFKDDDTVSSKKIKEIRDEIRCSLTSFVY